MYIFKKISKKSKLNKTFNNLAQRSSCTSWSDPKQRHSVLGRFWGKESTTTQKPGTEKPWSEWQEVPCGERSQAFFEKNLGGASSQGLCLATIDTPPGSISGPSAGADPHRGICLDNVIEAVTMRLGSDLDSPMNNSNEHLGDKNCGPNRGVSAGPECSSALPRGTDLRPTTRGGSDMRNLLSTTTRGQGHQPPLPTINDRGECFPRRGGERGSNSEVGKLGLAGK